jgi:hypothetical protein
VRTPKHTFLMVSCNHDRPVQQGVTHPPPNKHTGKSEAVERRDWTQRAATLMKTLPLMEAHAQLFAAVPDTSVLY